MLCNRRQRIYTAKTKNGQIHSEKNWMMTKANSTAGFYLLTSRPRAVWQLRTGKANPQQSQAESKHPAQQQPCTNTALFPSRTAQRNPSICVVNSLHTEPRAARIGWAHQRWFKQSAARNSLAPAEQLRCLCPASSSTGGHKTSRLMQHWASADCAKPRLAVLLVLGFHLPGIPLSSLPCYIQQQSWLHILVGCSTMPFML